MVGPGRPKKLSCPPKRIPITLLPKTKEELEQLGTMTDTFDDVVRMLLNFWYEKH